MINYVNTNIFDRLNNAISGEIIYLPHIVNNIGLWGKGFVLDITKWHPGVESHYREGFQQGLCELGDCLFTRVGVDPRIYVSHMVAQNGVRGKNNPKPIKYVALIDCMRLIATRCIDHKKNYKVSIHTIKFGSGLACGNWNFIEELIKEIWCSANIQVTIYEI